MVDTAQFLSQGWAQFAHDRHVADWVAHARPVAEAAVKDPANAQWLQCEGTWFVGVDALPNDPAGRLPGGPPLQGPALDLWRALGHDVPPLHRAQVSVIYPGYPRPRTGESDAAFRYRRDRDAAHVDGLLPVGPTRARKLREPHAFVLGMPMTQNSAGAAPLVVWDQSHHIMARHLRAVFETEPSENWRDLDLTAVYQAARRVVFDICQRREILVQPGESLLLHHMCVHGIAPWTASEPPDDSGRMMAYFRPEWPSGVQEWVTKG